MRTEKGIILRLTKLTETSLIVTWCVDTVGLVKTVAKGARRPKSMFAGKLDLFFTADLQWVDSARSELGSLRELVVTEYAEGIRKSYKNTVVAGYFSSLVEYVMESGSADEDIFGLLQRGYRYLNNEDARWKAVLHFERELVKLLGIWDEKTPAHLCIKRALGGLPKNRDSCQQCFDLET